MEPLEDPDFFPCCDHCMCGTPEGSWPTRSGHDDTCVYGCNDDNAKDDDVTRT